MKNPAYLVAPTRTPLGRRGGQLSSLTAVDLGVAAVRGTLQAAELKPDDVDEVIFGCAEGAGLGPNPARQISCGARIPASSPAYTISKACASGLQAVFNAVQLIQLGEASRVVAGGADSLSNVPRLLPRREGQDRVEEELQPADGVLTDLLASPLGGGSAIRSADAVARQYSISRSDLEQYTRKCRQRFELACRQRRFAAEIVGVRASGMDRTVRWLDEDEPAQDEPPGVGAENGFTMKEEESAAGEDQFPPLADGAASAIIVDENDFRRIQRFPACRVLDYATAGVEPAMVAIAPAPAVRKLLLRAGVSLGEIDLFELNEFSAAQVLACARELRMDLDRVNVSGGALNLGSPAGCAGARIVVTLAHEMRQRQARYGIAALGVSGGMGMAMLMENLQPWRRLDCGR